MNPHLPNHMNITGSPSPAIYRPKYRQRVNTSGYVLNGSVIREAEPGIKDAITALEEWRSQDEQENHPGVRWHADKLKLLQVYIQPPPQPDWHTLILKACREWEMASTGLIRFQHCVRPEHADICVEWTDTAVNGREFEVGHTNRTLQGPWISKVTITLLTEPVIDRHLLKPQIQDRLYTTALHEVGHALGLEHSTQAKDVMHHQGWRNKHLTPNDVSRLSTLYKRSSSTISWL